MPPTPQKTGSDLFETLEIKQEDIVEPLVNEPYTYENIVENPVIKPVAECDRSLRDIDEMINKKLVDAKREKTWINQAIDDVPAYQDSSFISRLIRFAQDTQDVIKLLNLQNKNYKKCIREMVELTKSRYAIKISPDANEYYEPQTVLPEKGPRGYLEKLTTNISLVIKECAANVLKFYEGDTTSTSEQSRFTFACQAAYKEEQDKTKKDIIGQIIRMEIK